MRADSLPGTSFRLSTRDRGRVADLAAILRVRVVKVDRSVIDG